MAFTDQDAQAEIAAYKPPDAQPHPMAAAPVSPLQAAQQPPPATTTPSFLDSVLSHTDSYLSHFGKYAADSTRDVASGLATGVVNTVDSAKSFIGASGKGLAMAEDPAHASGGVGEDADKREEDAADPFTPMYNDARTAALNVRDAIAVKDPGVADHLLEGAGQFIPSFLMFSRVIGSIGGLAKLGEGTDGLAGVAARFAAKSTVTASADAASAATTIAPHDPRMADTLALMRTSEGRFGDLLRSAAPDGSLLNGYINYIADHENEGEAEGRWRNVLDNANMAAALSGVIHTAGSVFKQGWGALHFMADNNMGSMSDLMPAAQEGKIGYHGSTADIAPGSTFDDSKIGTGEGNQSFGYGHYVAENPATAGTYQARLATRALGPLADARQALQKNGGDAVKAYNDLKSSLIGETDPGMQQRLRDAMSKVKNGNGGAGRGNLYTVHVADEHIASMLDHDSPLAQQKLPKPVMNVLEDAQEQEVSNGGVSWLGSPYATGADAYRSLSRYLGGDKAASKFLDSHGVPGIKYLDQGSRSAGSGTHNFVVFNGKNASITAKNGVGVERGQPQSMDLSKEERALERERIAAQRDAEEGVRREPEPEPVPRRAAEHEGEVARRNAAAAAGTAGVAAAATASAAEPGKLDTSKYALPKNDPAANEANWQKREDGTSKGHGFLGLLKRPDGRVSSEISIGTEINGKEVEIPTMIPTLSQKELDYLMTHSPDSRTLPTSIIHKAVEFAKRRIAAGKSPFASASESPLEK